MWLIGYVTSGGVTVCISLPEGVARFPSIGGWNRASHVTSKGGGVIVVTYDIVPPWEGGFEYKWPTFPQNECECGLSCSLQWRVNVVNMIRDPIVSHNMKSISNESI